MTIIKNRDGVGDDDDDDDRGSVCAGSEKLKSTGDGRGKAVVDNVVRIIDSGERPSIDANASLSFLD